jgi:molybdopterin-containing oxidoreductase family membrane subunit
MGRPDRFLHIMPFLGTPNWPRSMLAWDALVLNSYLVLNLVLVLYLLFKTYRGEPYDKRIFLPLVLLSIPVSISTHTVTAFLYNGMAARPYWNASILAPRFIASAFCSGPAVMIILFQVLRKAFRFEIKDEAIWKIAELMSYAMFLNLFLLGAELFKEYYSATQDLRYTQYLWQGLGEHRALVPYAWFSLACSVASFVLFLIPRTRRSFLTLNLGCVLIWAGVYIEKGMGLIIPGFTPSTLGQIYPYTPTPNEWGVAVGVFGIGFLVFTVLVKIAVPILVGTFRAPARSAEHPSPAHEAGASAP